MTPQQAKDQAAREAGYRSWDVLLAYNPCSDNTDIINRALELYGDAQWNAAIEKAAEEAEAYIGVNDEPIVSKGSILKLKKP